ncbi:hypothetical protein H5410_061265 [Solanum commersonii]|uniref:Uncharacterized protein n=1 Tax=Solanum commersonii TaxID=4109 RepID=A0A9J5W783_SOLCO|nr:hypothetical protein H5410_061265 [Solanum commersonii]
MGKCSWGVTAIQVEINRWVHAFNRKFSRSSHYGPLGGIVLHHETIRRSANCSFHCHFDPLPSRLCILEQRVEFVLSANRQRCLVMLKLQLLRFFQPFSSFLRLSVHASTKTSNT